MTDEQEIRDLIERWAAAVHSGDLAAVTADHAQDIVMFDVPPPEQGVLGIDAYRETWPAFFDWQRAGAVFEIESLEVTAGADVAFAFALLRCGTPTDFDRNPASRLRLTIGLRKLVGRWEITHEHHSFTHTPQPPDTAVVEVQAIHQQWFERTATKDVDGLMEHVAPDIVSYERAGPLQYVGIDDVREVCRRGLESSPGQIDFDIPDLTVRADGDVAVAWGLDRIAAEGTETRSRGTPRVRTSRRTLADDPPAPVQPRRTRLTQTRRSCTHLAISATLANRGLTPAFVFARLFAADGSERRVADGVGPFASF